MGRFIDDPKYASQLLRTEQVNDINENAWIAGRNAGRT